MQVIYFLGDVMNAVIISGLVASAIVIPRDLLRDAFNRYTRRNV